MSPFTKTYFATAFAVLAIVEFWLVMQVMGKRGSGPNPHAKLLMRLHRIGGWVFLVGMIGLFWVGFDLLERLTQAGNYDVDARVFGHILLAFSLAFLLLLKIGFVRLYRRYTPYVPLLGILVTGVTLVIWGVAGLCFLFMMGGVQPG